MTTLKLDMAFGSFDRKHVLHYIGKQIWMIMVGNMTHALYYSNLWYASKKKDFLKNLCNLAIYCFDCHEYNKATETFNLIDEKVIKLHIRNRLKRCKSKLICKALENNYMSQTNKISYMETEMIENVIPDAIESFIPVLSNNTIDIEDITISSNEQSTSISALTLACTEQGQYHIKHN